MELLKVKEPKGNPVKDETDVVELMSDVCDADRECFWVLHLNTRLKLIERELVSMGSLDSSIVHPREAFKKAIINGAASIITVHNHPSGDPSPSEDDRRTWAKLDEAGRILSIEVLDHFIIAPNSRYYSNKKERLG